MTTKTYIATDAEAAALRDGKKTLLVIPMEPQPKTGTSICTCESGVKHVYPANRNPSGVVTIKAPYAPGDIVGVKEAWLLSAFWGCDTDDVYICYRCEDSEHRPDSPRHIGHSVRKRAPEHESLAVEMHERHKQQMKARGKTQYWWHPAQCMPAWAIRTRLRILTVDARLAGSITPEEMLAMGFAKITKDNGITWKYGIPDYDGLPGTDDVGWPWKMWNADAMQAMSRYWNTLHPQHPFERTWAWFIGVKAPAANERGEIVNSQ